MFVVPALQSGFRLRVDLLDLFRLTTAPAQSVLRAFRPIVIVAMSHTLRILDLRWRKFLIAQETCIPDFVPEVALAPSAGIE